jgi:hypothetical protein
MDRIAAIMPSTQPLPLMAKSESGATMEIPIDLSRKPELFRQTGTYSESFWTLI